ncbi:uncharacterized protein I206_106769 [Kwoniella pini CBS 10737]|uniref:FAD-binding FR-type domain-containing protein n=1 Tax=Kwoniella pini CBS 10737 TaxID=1296096 RepID=A0A1B9HT99_9TREE|nr:uncharacterized protein I206_07343 [Kwoniella pini CBS 10737]OCF46490.1 hypothetical protein I206_07343 [Kwoniella pini CBS 10737]
MSRRTSIHSTIINEQFKSLSEDEIITFLDDLDHNNDGNIQYSEVEAKLDQVNDELTPNPKTYNINHPSKEDAQRHAFLRSILGNDDVISRERFAERVRGWGIPSLKQELKEENAERKYMKTIGTWRRFRSWWAIKGPEIVFLALVIGSMIGFGLWQCLKYALESRYTAAFGWGVVMAKTCAGALYPTLFFLILSMSRYFSTFLRKWYLISRFINWDLSQSFHIKMSLAAIILATLHAIGHLSGSFVFGSSPNRQQAVAVILSPELVPRPYIEYVRSLPGFSGLTALGLFYLILILSLPQVRRWNYEVFQLGHLLMYPIIGLLMAHGTARLLQGPMLGYFLAFPTLLILVERLIRVFIGFRGIPATIRTLDSETIQIVASISSYILTIYRPGQYVFLQIPRISTFQWHPFTVSTCINDQLHLHIKTDGNWTRKLRDLIPTDEKEVKIKIGLNGPFGAPAERFYDYTHTVLIGSGIGVTPFSGILADLQAKHNGINGESVSVTKEGNTIGDDNATRVNSSSSNPDYEKRRSSRTLTEALSRTVSRRRSQSRRNSGTSPFPEDYKRVDFHWMVRDKNHLTWFSNLLNTISRSQEWHRSNNTNTFPHLDIRLQTHVTAKRKSITTHVYRWLLELHRTDEHPESPLTGLINPSHYGRPDFVKILDKHYDDMVEYKRLVGETDGEKLKVGVFFCGAPIIGKILADRCRILNKRGAEEGTGIQYHLMIEVFG